jgi:hypothetical protein
MAAALKQHDDLTIGAADAAGGRLWRWRGLGALEDLDVDFAKVERPLLTTELLARCCDDAGGDLSCRREDALGLTLAARIGGLTAIHAQTLGEDRIAVSLRCPLDSCGEALEAALPVEAIVEMARLAEAEPQLVVAGTGSRPLALRRPTGVDQLRWLSRNYPSASIAEAAMLQSLLPQSSPGPLPADLVRLVGEQLEELDPLPCFAVVTLCPACGWQGEIAVDLEAVLLAGLHRAQRRMLADIHVLASRYGWREQDVLAIPPKRRADYRRMIAEETLP